MAWTAQTAPSFPAPAWSGHLSGLVLSGWWRRVGGSLLDGVILSGPLLIVESVFGTTGITFSGNAFNQMHQAPTHVALRILFLVIGLATSTTYGIWMLGRRGQTVGMMATGIRAIDQATGGPLTWRQTIRRVIALYLIAGLWTDIGFFVMLSEHLATTSGLSNLFTALGFIGSATTFLWPLGSAQNQTLQDKVAGTIVVKT